MCMNAPLVKLFSVSDDSVAATLNGEEFLEWSWMSPFCPCSHPNKILAKLTLDDSEGLTWMDESAEIYYQF